MFNWKQHLDSSPGWANRAGYSPPLKYMKTSYREAEMGQQRFSEMLRVLAHGWKPAKQRQPLLQARWQGQALCLHQYSNVGSTHQACLQAFLFLGAALLCSKTGHMERTNMLLHRLSCWNRAQALWSLRSTSKTSDKSMVNEGVKR